MGVLSEAVLSPVPSIRRAVAMLSPSTCFPPISAPHRLKQLSEEPYTQEEAERAAGMGSYIPPKKVHVQTQPLDEVVEMEASS